MTLLKLVRDDEADVETVKAMREYERKLRNRKPVLTEIALALHRCGEEQRAAAHEPHAPSGERAQPLVVGNGLPGIRTYGLPPYTCAERDGRVGACALPESPPTPDSQPASPHSPHSRLR